MILTIFKIHLIVVLLLCDEENEDVIDKLVMNSTPAMEKSLPRFLIASYTPTAADSRTPSSFLTYQSKLLGSLCFVAAATSILPTFLLIAIELKDT